MPGTPIHPDVSGRLNDHASRRPYEVQQEDIQRLAQHAGIDGFTYHEIFEEEARSRVVHRWPMILETDRHLTIIEASKGPLAFPAPWDGDRGLHPDAIEKGGAK